MKLTKTILASLAGAALTSCAELPVAGPDKGAIYTGAVTALPAPPEVAGARYALVDITVAVVECLQDYGADSLYRSFGMGKGSAPEILVGPGDVLQVTIFETGSGGLFVPSDAAGRPGNYVTLPAQGVDSTGNISIPYAGQVKAANRTPQQIQREIEEKLANRAVEPQAVVAVNANLANEVTVVGEVNGARRSPVRAGGSRILDAIADAGGIRHPGYETYVTLQRGSRRATALFDSLVRHPAENIYVMPGDTIYVYREQRKFMAVGAVLASAVNLTAQTAQFAFDQPNLTLNEAVARAGGLLDERADPGHVFLYRLENREALRRVGVDLSGFPKDQRQIPTIYHANFRDPAGYFLAQRFLMHNKDIVYVSNSESVEVRKFLAYVRSFTATVAGVAGDVALVRQAGGYVVNGINADEHVVFSTPSP